MISMICLLQWMIVPVYAADIEFTECSKLMQATVKVDATEQPDINSAVITTFEQGAPMLVTGESQSGWYRITFQGKDGYVKMDAVEAAVQVEGESLEELDREDLLFFIGCYNNYIIEFYDEHEEGMIPVCAYEFFDNEFQEILKEQENYE